MSDQLSVKIPWERTLHQGDRGPVASYHACTRVPEFDIGRFYSINQTKWPGRGIVFILSIQEDLFPDADFSLVFSTNAYLDSINEALELAEQWEDMDVVRDPDTGKYGLAAR